VSILIREDLPTLDLPIKAYSGLSGLGQLATSGLLIKYFAVIISIVFENVLCTFVATMQPAQRSNPVIVPDQASNLSKKAQVADMFNNIAARYDFLNHFLSLGIDKGWRRKAIAEIGKISPKHILDVATGTGDLAIAAVALKPEKITGIDIAEQMLDAGRNKIAGLNLSDTISLLLADSESMPFSTDSFDAVTCAYGVRNFEQLEAGLKEMCRVLRPGGRVAILEFSQPVTFPVKQLYKFYFRFILPGLGKLVSKHSRAYTYLPESVMAFPQGKEFTDILLKCGFKEVTANPLTFGITTLYCGTK
jgi:demethylmenaquinone methyltransferase/2-methoxy-6-polyprenyl-1,4-benzoquinol methylase